MKLKINPLKIATVVYVAVRTAIDEVEKAKADDGKVTPDEVEGIVLHIAAAVAEAIRPVIVKAVA